MRVTGRPGISVIEMKNTIITIIISFLSVLMHVMTFLVKCFGLNSLVFSLNNKSNHFNLNLRFLWPAT
jgi:hypothetical protein